MDLEREEVIMPAYKVYPGLYQLIASKEYFFIYVHMRHPLKKYFVTLESSKKGF